MDAVHVAPRVILDAMLDTLQLPKPLYYTETTGRNSMQPVLQFCPSFPGNTERRCVLHDPSAGEEEVKNLLAKEAIEFMELTYNKTPCDHSYLKLQSIQKELNCAEKINQCLCNQIEEKDKIIECLTKGLDASVGAGYRAGKELQRIINTNFSPGSTNADHQINHALLHVQYVATYIDESTLISDDILQKTENDPCRLANDDFKDADELGAFNYNSSADELRSNSGISYDSDGRHYQDDSDY